jgi:2-hydroxy-6-oxonona-2,4-dienedioate hydrolase
MITRRQALLLGATGLAIGAGDVGNSYSGSIAKARRRVAGVSELIPTPFGEMEYAIAGNGPSLLMIHGTGGGFDQGLTFADAIMRRGHRIVSPSRFGYLRSAFPADPSSENQADAFVRLLDHLRIDRLPVAGGSAGALSAAQFALRHPDRCSGLILLVPAANVSSRDPVQMGPLQEFLVMGLVRSDFLYWAALQAAPGRLVGTLLATDPRLLAHVGAQERRRAYRILEELMPISARSRGMLNDGRLAGRPARMDFGQIDLPTLLISVEDDRFGTAATARRIAPVMRRAKLVIYPSGGHIWLGHDEDVADEVTRFMRSIAKNTR